MKHHHSALISSAGRRVALLRAFTEARNALSLSGRIVAVDSSPLSAACQLADVHYQVPPCGSPKYISTLLEICERERIGLLVPTIDTELPVLARNRRILESAGVALILPDESVVRLCADKRLMSAFLDTNGLPHPRQWRIEDFDVGLIARSPRAFIAKPARGSSSIGVRILTGTSTVDELGEYVVEEVAEGQEFTVDVYVDQRGRTIAVVPRQRLETRGGEVSKGVTRRSSAIDALTRRLVAALSVRACVLTVQLFYDAVAGTGSIIEVNARFGGGYPLSHRAGADFPLWLMKEHFLGESLPEANAWEADVLMLRFDDAVFASGFEALHS